ncbi:unnamed protein product [Vitrella brassicaformis CCMP3155]|uniref:RNA helicase n=1 Tax=Vitrella brassicaformis (strain CCMP3155) TaxID=1169540 RepID=A0A0G4EHH0_VITBC|nr:unnamed protein product [Vitrella brassicaformis CCMP3155]|eukprot:CEL95428.1 unnamed protein product [Vitrella brassicaformis CCMP3155]
METNQDVNGSIEDAAARDAAATGLPSFDDLSISGELQEGLRHLDVTLPAAIQRRAVPEGLRRKNLIIQADSGSGKTIAFLLVALQNFLNDRSTDPALTSPSPSRPFGAIVGPTREVALQLSDIMQRLTWLIKPRPVVVGLLGGVPLHLEAAKMPTDGPVDFVVATPGKLLEVLGRDMLRFDELRVLVLDEADRLLDHEMRAHIRHLLEHCWRDESLQILIASATLHAPTVTVLERIIEGVAALRGIPPEHFSIEFTRVLDCSIGPTQIEDAALTTVPDDSRTVVCSPYLLNGTRRAEDTSDECPLAVSEWSVSDDGGNRRAPASVGLSIGVPQGVKYYRCVCEDAEDDYGKVAVLIDLVSRWPFVQALIFCNDHALASLVTNELSKLGLQTTYSSECLTQRERMHSYRKVKTRECRVLVCSDLLARGLDFEAVDLVVNLDLPESKEIFLHRSGRAGRFGRGGKCVSLITPDEAASLLYFERQLGMQSHTVASNNDASEPPSEQQLFSLPFAPYLPLLVAESPAALVDSVACCASDGGCEGMMGDVWAMHRAVWGQGQRVR